MARFPSSIHCGRIADLHCVDPLTDPRWTEFTDNHPRASIFHTSAWLRALYLTYGCVPAVLTTATPEQKLSDGLVYCSSSSWLSGKKLVSVPFSDHCDVLTDGDDARNHLLAGLAAHVDAGKWRSYEIRPLTDPPENKGLLLAGRYYHHVLDISRQSDQLFSGFHKDCIQRRIRRAEKQALVYENGSSDSLVGRFYGLVVITRRYQGLLPQPFQWFQNLARCMGDKLTIHLVSTDGKPIAGILTLRYKDTLVYKYSCSDRTYNSLGSTPFLIWRAIEQAKRQGVGSLDLGRSDPDNLGLVRFKDRWGSVRSVLSYWRYGAPTRPILTSGWMERAAGTVIRGIPSWLLPHAGRFVYKHVQRSSFPNGVIPRVSIAAGRVRYDTSNDSCDLPISSSRMLGAGLSGLG